MTPDNNYLSIGDTAKMLHVSIETLRRWDSSGKFTAIRTQGDQRRYSVESIDEFLKENLFWDAKRWAIKGEVKPVKIFYCPTRSIFEARNATMEKFLEKEIGEAYSLISTSAGEIGNNSFDHNLGKWTDVMGVYFGYNIERRQIVLADRGIGVLKTLQQTLPKLTNDKEALEIAFTKIVSGRAPEARGNGLKYVRRNVEDGYFKLTFQTGNTELILDAGKPFSDDNIKEVKENIPGCLAILEF